MNGLRAALAIIQGNISLKFGVQKRLRAFLNPFFIAGAQRESVFADSQLPEPSQALPRQLSRRESQAVKFSTKVLRTMRKCPLPHKTARERLRGFSTLKETSMSAPWRAFQIVWHNQQKPRRAVCSAGLLSIGKEV